MGCFFMKINKTDRILPIYENMTIKRPTTNKKGLNKDGLEISERAQDYQFALKKLKELPEIRQEKVDEIKERIQTGTYNVSGKEIVDKIYESINFDKKI